MKCKADKYRLTNGRSPPVAGEIANFGIAHFIWLMIIIGGFVLDRPPELFKTPKRDQEPIMQ